MTIDQRFLHLSSISCISSCSDPNEDIVYFADLAARADVTGRIERARARRPVGHFVTETGGYGPGRRPTKLSGKPGGHSQTEVQYPTHAPAGRGASSSETTSRDPSADCGP